MVCVSKQWYGCQCSALSMCAQILVHATNCFADTTRVCTKSGLWEKNPFQHREVKPTSAAHQTQCSATSAMSPPQRKARGSLNNLQRMAAWTTCSAWQPEQHGSLNNLQYMAAWTTWQPEQHAVHGSLNNMAAWTTCSAWQPEQPAVHGSLCTNNQIFCLSELKLKLENFNTQR